MTFEVYQQVKQMKCTLVLFLLCKIYDFYDDIWFSQRGQQLVKHLVSCLLYYSLQVCCDFSLLKPEEESENSFHFCFHSKPLSSCILTDVCTSFLLAAVVSVYIFTSGSVQMM